MALQFEYTPNNGLPIVSNAYATITRFSGDSQTVNLTVSTYASIDAYNSKLSPLEVKIYRLPYSDGLNISSAYTQLSALSDFAGAVIVS